MALRISGDGSLNLSDVTLDNVTASGLSASGNVVLPSTTEIGAVSSTELGYVDGVTSALQTQLNTLDSGLASKLDLAGGKILQIVRATDSVSRTTTSLTLVDANISVTITPQKSTSTIILLWIFQARSPDVNFFVGAITDSSNNALSGAEEIVHGDSSSNNCTTNLSSIAYSTPATTSAVTYKGRFRSTTVSDSAEVRNASTTGQLYAIEVSA